MLGGGMGMLAALDHLVSEVDVVNEQLIMWAIFSNDYEEILSVEEIS